MRSVGLFSGPCEPLKGFDMDGTLCCRWVESSGGEAVRWPMLEVGETAVGRGRGEPWSLLEVTSRSAARAGEVGAVVARPPPARRWRSLEEEDLGPLRLCPRSRGALGSGAPPGLMHGRGFELEVMPYGV